MEALIYIAAILLGALLSEFIHFNKNQAKYSRGTKTIGEQIDKWLIKRWDNLFIAVGLGALFTLVVHNTANADAVTQLILDKIGMESVTLSVSGYALVAIFSAFSEWIGRKIGIIKEDKTEG